MIVMVDVNEYQKRVLDCITTGEIDKFLDNSVYKDKSECKQAMIYGMCIASMLTSDVGRLFAVNEEK